VRSGSRSTEPGRKKQTLDIEQIIASAKRPETTVPLCMRGDLQAVWEQLDRDFDTADKEITDEVTNGGSPVRAVKIAKQMEELEREMRDSIVVFTLRGLPRTRWKELAEAHPPIEGVDEGEVNEEGFVTEMISECCVKPAMTVEQASRLQDQLTDGQWQELATASWQLNKSMISVPYSLAASTRLAISAAEG
jgi:hypothetical protein